MKWFNFIPAKIVSHKKEEATSRGSQNRVEGSTILLKLSLSTKVVVNK